MIKLMKNQKNIKWILVFFLLGIVLSISSFGVMSVNRLNLLIEIERNNDLQIVGTQGENINTGQAVMEVWKGVKNEEAVERGKELLKQYGYTDKVAIQSTYTIEKVKLSLLYNQIILFLCAGVFITLILTITHRNHKQELEQIAMVLACFNKGDYRFRAPTVEEGIKSKLYQQLEQLGTMVALTNSRLQEEKEGTKALVTDISHQLKTPLASLSTCFSLLSEENLNKTEREEFLLRSKEQVARLERLIAALVNISRMELGLIHIRMEENDMKETIIQAIDSVYMKAEEKNITIVLAQIESIIIPHDAKWTAEAIANILDNAIKYSPKKSTIQVRTNIMTNYIRIEIQDEGIGIKKEEYNEIFKRFYRGKSELVKKSEGSGVGLYLTRKILEEQGGNIKAVSKIGEGSTFVLQLLKSNISIKNNLTNL